MYTMELVQLVDSYKRAFPWIFRALQQDGGRRWTIEEIFPDLEPGEQSAKLQEVRCRLLGAFGVAMLVFLWQCRPFCSDGVYFDKAGKRRHCWFFASKSKP
jgi:hypothetical protein